MLEPQRKISLKANRAFQSMSTDPWSDLLPAIGEPMPYAKRWGLQEVLSFNANVTGLWVQRAAWHATAGYMTASDTATGDPRLEGYPAITYDLYDLTTGAVLETGVSSIDQPMPGFWNVVDTSQVTMPSPVASAGSRYRPPRAR